MSRPFNFSAGPGVMPPQVLARAASEMRDWHGCGMSVMEMSHRGKEFISIYEQAQTDLRELLAIPNNFHILFMQGGAIAENAIVPLNLSRGTRADYVLSGAWSQKSLQEARKYCLARIAASSEDNGFTSLPSTGSWDIGADASYVHICSNETIHGVEFHELPDLAALGCRAPLVIDFSSQVASRTVNWSRVGLAYGGAQKNIGPAGLTVVVVREDLLGHALPACPSAFDYKLVADSQSMFNTPPTYAIYMAGLIFQWLKEQGGIAAIEARNIAKAGLLYEAIDNSQIYVNHVLTDCRSRMNVPFFLRDPGADGSRTEAFLAGAWDHGLLQLKGHKAVGGMRASLYNAMPIEGVQALIQYMREFERRS